MLLLAILMAADVWGGGPTWVFVGLSVVAALPGLQLAYKNRWVSWLWDYRWAVAKADWPRALDRATRLHGILDENRVKSMQARAHAGSGQMDRARELMSQLTVWEGFPRASYLNDCMWICTEASDYDGGLRAALAVVEEAHDPASSAQTVAAYYALFFQDGARARPYLEQAESLRGRGKQAEFYLDATEVFVRVEEGETSAVLSLLDKLLPLAEVYVATVPEMWQMQALLHAYACLARAATDPSRAAQHLELAAPIITTRGPERLFERCELALAAKPSANGGQLQDSLH